MPPINRAKYSHSTELAAIIEIQHMDTINSDIMMVFLVPKYPFIAGPKKAPATPPRLKIETTHDASSSVNGIFDSFEVSREKFGDAQPI